MCHNEQSNPDCLVQPSEWATGGQGGQVQCRQAGRQSGAGRLLTPLPSTHTPQHAWEPLRGAFTYEGVYAPVPTADGACTLHRQHSPTHPPTWERRLLGHPYRGSLPVSNSAPGRLAGSKVPRLPPPLPALPHAMAPWPPSTWERRLHDLHDRGSLPDTAFQAGWQAGKLPPPLAPLHGALARTHSPGSASGEAAWSVS